MNACVHAWSQLNVRCSQKTVIGVARLISGLAPGSPVTAEQFRAGFQTSSMRGFGKVPTLESSSAAVAALVSSHRVMLDLCGETSYLMSGMSMAFRTLSEAHAGLYRGPQELVKSFLDCVDRELAAIISVRQ